jgi:hypothetical protein
MVHAKLILAGKCPDHNALPWCEEIERLSPLVLANPIQAKPVHPRRVGGVNKRVALEGHLTRSELASWPHSLRPACGNGRILKVSTY